ncbi:MAG: hypothetical protein KBD39_04310 [Sterolibacterium sp.]|jgi:hypothetical protein|nr:hypothetical protein [Sterolibacterium sp.]MBP9799321.1 hypothetical protein [Sterolibacterium sp.]
MAGLSPGALRKLETDGQCLLEPLVRVAQALGLLDMLNDLFVLKRQSIPVHSLAGLLQVDMLKRAKSSRPSPKLPLNVVRSGGDWWIGGLDMLRFIRNRNMFD